MQVRKIFSILFSLFILLTFNSLFAQHSITSAYKIDRIDGNFKFLEGPVWYQGSILFSDIPANKIYSWNEEEGVKVFYEPSGNSNGLMLDLNGFLILAQHGNRQVAVLDDRGEEFGLIMEYKGKKLNSPNDLALRFDGSIYFTDPPYGISSDQAELDFSGIYLWTMQDELFLLDKSFPRPNGIALSPDQNTLYVTESPSRKVYAWDIEENSIKNKRVLAVIDQEGGNADGMKVDKEGYLYVTGPGGVWVFSPEGKKMDLIEIPGQVTNCAFGGEKGSELFVTTANALYRLYKKK
jgi:gluconolactonase